MLDRRNSRTNLLSDAGADARDQIGRRHLGNIVGVDHNGRYVVAGGHTFKLNNQQISRILGRKRMQRRQEGRAATTAQAAIGDLNGHLADLSGRSGRLPPACIRRPARVWT